MIKQYNSWWVQLTYEGTVSWCNNEDQNPPITNNQWEQNAPITIITTIMATKSHGVRTPIVHVHPATVTCLMPQTPDLSLLQPALHPSPVSTACGICFTLSGIHSQQNSLSATNSDLQPVYPITWQRPTVRGWNVAIHIKVTTCIFLVNKMIKMIKQS